MFLLYIKRYTFHIVNCTFYIAKWNSCDYRQNLGAMDTELYLIRCLFSEILQVNVLCRYKFIKWKKYDKEKNDMFKYAAPKCCLMLPSNA